MNAALRESLYDLYEQGGLELMAQGTHGLKRELIIDLETTGLDPDQHEIIRLRAVNRWNEADAFDEWARPSIPLSPEAERILGVTNEQLDHCPPNAILSTIFERKSPVSASPAGCAIKSALKTKYHADIATLYCQNCQIFPFASGKCGLRKLA